MAMMPGQEQMPHGEYADQARGEQAPGGDASAQLEQLVTGVNQGLGLLKEFVVATPDVPEEVGAMLEQASKSFAGAMEILTSGTAQEQSNAEGM